MKRALLAASRQHRELCLYSGRLSMPASTEDVRGCWQFLQVVTGVKWVWHVSQHLRQGRNASDRWGQRLEQRELPQYESLSQLRNPTQMVLKKHIKILKMLKSIRDFWVKEVQSAVLSTHSMSMISFSFSYKNLKMISCCYLRFMTLELWTAVFYFNLALTWGSKPAWAGTSGPVCLLWLQPWLLDLMGVGKEMKAFG